MVKEHGEQDEALQEMVASSVHEALGMVAQDLRDELSRHVDARLKETSLPGDAAPTLGRYETNPYTHSLDTQLRTSALSDLGAQHTLTGGTGGLTPSGDGSLPPGFALPGLQAFQPTLSSLGTMPPWPQMSWSDLPLSTLTLPASSSTSAGGVIVGHLSPPVPAKLVWKIWRGE